MPHTLFPTAFGTCGLAWEGDVVTGFQLPENDVEATERHGPAAGPPTPRDPSGCAAWSSPSKAISRAGCRTSPGSRSIGPG